MVSSRIPKGSLFRRMGNASGPNPILDMVPHSWSVHREPRFYRNGIQPCTVRKQGVASFLLVADTAALVPAFPALLVVVVIGRVETPLAPLGDAQHHVILSERSHRKV